MALKIIFMGTPEFAVPVLKSINESNHNILEVYTQPPKKKNRGQRESFTPVHDFSVKNKIKVRHPEKLDTNEEINFIKKTKPDVVVVVAYGKIIPKKILEIENINFINIHASLLPKLRGAAPIQRSIMNLDKETGISVMRIVEQLDTGPVCNVYKINIENNVNAEEVSEKLSSLAAEKILDNIDDIYEDKANFIEQDNSSATYAPKIQKSEGQINWKEDAKIIIGKINGLYPAPGAFFIFNGERYKILKAEIGQGKGKPGEVLSDYLEISCGDKKSLKISEIQRQGKKPQSISEFVLGTQIKKGSFL